MVFPRKSPNSLRKTREFFIERIGHKILYYSGTLEPIANFFILMPIYVMLVHLFGRNQLFGKRKSFIAVAICIGLSAAIEITQKSIPGRISSLQDFTLNTSGVVVASLLHLIYNRKRLSLLTGLKTGESQFCEY